MWAGTAGVVLLGRVFALLAVWEVLIVSFGVFPVAAGKVGEVEVEGGAGERRRAVVDIVGVGSC